MVYTDIISLAQAKVALRVDSGFTADDANITRMIKSAFSFIEGWTNIMLYDRDKDYFIVDCKIRVYDYPINSVVAPAEADMTITQKTGYTIYEYSSTDTTTLTLNVGYDDVANVPDRLIEVAYEIIDNLYYRNEESKDGKMGLSPFSIGTLNQYKRFII